MTDKSSDAESELRQGEVVVALPAQSDAALYFIGTIRTPWRTRQECPKRGSLDGPICSIVVDERWRMALTGLAGHRRIQVLYWMQRARRDLVLQTPFSTMRTTGTFALRSPVRPNPIASSVVELVAIDGVTLQVRGLDCLDGTPLRRHQARTRSSGWLNAAATSSVALPPRPAPGSRDRGRGTVASNSRSWANR